MFSIPSFAALAQFSGVLHLSVFHQASHRVQGRVPSEIAMSNINCQSAHLHTVRFYRKFGHFCQVFRDKIDESFLRFFSLTNHRSLV